jgi:hypothetical protein
MNLLSAKNEASTRLERNKNITYGVSQGLCEEWVNNSSRHSTSALDQPAPPVTAVDVNLFLLPCRRLFKSIVKGTRQRLETSTIQDAHLFEKV